MDARMMMMIFEEEESIVLHAIIILQLFHSCTVLWQSFVQL